MAGAFLFNKIYRPASRLDADWFNIANLAEEKNTLTCLT